MPSIDPAKLKAARERSGLRRERVATELGKSYLTVQAYELGGAIPPGNVLIRLAAMYGVTVESLCADETPAGTR
jgi:transcriptional regulator with XRE-family HTH domain